MTLYARTSTSCGAARASRSRQNVIQETVRRPLRASAVQAPFRRPLQVSAALASLRQSAQRLAPAPSVVELSGTALRPFLSTKEEEHMTIVYYLTQHCGPCKIAAPVIRRWAGEFDAAHVSFAKMDCGASPENALLASDLGIKAFPTFQVYKGKALIGTSVGAKMLKLKELITDHIAGTRYAP